MATNNSSDAVGVIIQSFFEARDRVRTAAYDLTNIAARLNELDEEFGNSGEPHPLNGLARRVGDACTNHLVRPGPANGFPAIPDLGAGSQPATAIDGRLANMPPVTDEDRTAMLLHDLMQCITLVALSIGGALRDFREIEREMEEFSSGSSTTIAGIHSVMVPIFVGLKKSLVELEAQCELAGYESVTYTWEEDLRELFLGIN
jgi:hypothetical protein